MVYDLYTSNGIVHITADIKNAERWYHKLMIDHHYGKIAFVQLRNHQTKEVIKEEANI